MLNFYSLTLLHWEQVTSNFRCWSCNLQDSQEWWSLPQRHYLLLSFVLNSVFESKSYKNLCVSTDITVNSPIPTGLKGLFQKFYRAMMTHQETVPFLIGSKKQAPSKSHTETIEWWGVAMGLSIKCRKSWWPEVALMATHNPFTSIDIFHLSRSCKKWEKRSCLSCLLFSFLFLALIEVLVVPRKSFPCHTRCSVFSLAEKASWKCQDSYQFVNKNKSALIELWVPHAEQGTRHMLSHWFFPPTNGRWVKIIHNSSYGQKNQHTLCYLNIPPLPLSPQFQWWQKLQGEETKTKQKQTEIPLKR